MAEEVSKELFVNVYGYDDVKEELNLIRGWLKDEEIINNPKIMVPHGIVFYGAVGCGKTLILRDFAESFNSPIYIIEGKSENLSNEIIETFEKARQDKFAVILIDEIDLLIGKSSHVERTLQQEMDGVNQKGKILVLATTNYIDDLSPALTRPGRFDRTIEISYPDKESRKQIFAKFLGELDMPLDNVDLNHVAKVCYRCNGAEIKAIINDAYLRVKKNVTTEELERSYARIIGGEFDEKKNSQFRDKRVAIHEAGHALMALRFNENFTFYSAKFNSVGGVTEVQEAEERIDTIEKREQNIMIGLSGFIAEEVYFGYHDVGSYNDYQKVHDYVTRLVERVCMKGIKHLIPSYRDNNTRYESATKRRQNEKLVNKLMRKYISKTKRWFKSHIDTLEFVANAMYDNGQIMYSDVSSLVPSLK